MYFCNGNNLFNAKEYESAIKMYKKAVECKDNEASSCYNMGICYLRLKNYDKAIENFRKALELNKDSKYYFNLAYTYGLKNDSRKSLYYFNLAWTLNEKDSECEKAINIILKNYRNKKRE